MTRRKVEEVKDNASGIFRNEPKEMWAQRQRKSQSFSMTELGERTNDKPNSGRGLGMGRSKTEARVQLGRVRKEIAQNPTNDGQRENKIQGEMGFEVGSVRL